ncbi:MAG TPA: rod shape-determining protein MreD [Gaiellaceae bacterium]|nr:rod shape-determining protein MreD [Gaiellaceae bacterium]
MIADALKAGGVFFVAVVLQAAIVSGIEPGGGSADLVLVTLTATALVRGSIFGALAGFYAGLLLDTANLETLGLSSLLLTLAGYWIGRYGETTGRDRLHAPLLAIAVVTVLYSLGSLGMHSLLGDPVSVRAGLVDALPAQIVLNLLLTIPVYALCRRIFTRADGRPAVEVEFGTS